MSDHGGSDENERPSAVIIPVTTTLAGSSPAAAADDAANHRSAPALPRPSRVVVLCSVLALLVVGAVTALGFVTYRDWRDRRELATAEREVAEQQAAVHDVQAVVAGYALPDSVDAQECGFGGSRCGSTALEPRAAVAAVAPSLAARGLQVGEVLCDTGRPATDTGCRAEVRFHGQSIGGIHATRRDVPYRVFGVPTSVTVVISQPTDYDAVYQDTDVPISTAERRAAPLPSDLDRALACRDRSADGCARYRARIAVADRDAFWLRTGRALNRLGWRGLDGHCDPARPDETCTLFAERVTDHGHELYLMVTVGSAREHRDRIRAFVSLMATERVPA